jgi:biotin carboxyl carrier protein
MKMMREVTASYDGVVKEIMVNKGAMVQTDDILMVVEPIDE